MYSWRIPFYTIIYMGEYTIICMLIPTEADPLTQQGLRKWDLPFGNWLCGSTLIWNWRWKGCAVWIVWTPTPRIPWVEFWVFQSTNTFRHPCKFPVSCMYRVLSIQFHLLVALPRVFKVLPFLLLGASWDCAAGPWPHRLALLSIDTVGIRTLNLSTARDLNHWAIQPA